jgi:hypothetical protein
LEEKAKQGNNRKRLLMWLISIWGGVFAILNNFVSLRYKQTDQSLKKH